MRKCGGFIKIIGLKIDVFMRTRIIFDGCASTADEADEIIRNHQDKNAIFVRIPCTFTYGT